MTVRYYPDSLEDKVGNLSVDDVAEGRVFIEQISITEKLHHEILEIYRHSLLKLKIDEIKNLPQLHITTYTLPFSSVKIIVSNKLDKKFSLSFKSRLRYKFRHSAYGLMTPPKRTHYHLLETPYLVKAINVRNKILHCIFVDNPHEILQCDIYESLSAYIEHTSKNLPPLIHYDSGYYAAMHRDKMTSNTGNVQRRESHKEDKNQP